MKFRGNVKIPQKGQIPRLGLKFCGPQKTVGPSYDAVVSVLQLYWKHCPTLISPWTMMQ